MTDERKNVQTTPPAPTASAVGLCPTLIQISRTPRHWKFTQHHCTTRPPPYTSEQTGKTQIRLLFREQSDQGLLCLSFYLHLPDALPHCKTKLVNFRTTMVVAFGVTIVRIFMVVEIEFTDKMIFYRERAGGMVFEDQLYIEPVGSSCRSVACRHVHCTFYVHFPSICIPY